MYLGKKHGMRGMGQGGGNEQSQGQTNAPQSPQATATSTQQLVSQNVTVQASSPGATTGPTSAGAQASASPTASAVPFNPNAPYIPGGGAAIPDYASSWQYGQPNWGQSDYGQSGQPVSAGFGNAFTPATILMLFGAAGVALFFMMKKRHA